MQLAKTAAVAHTVHAESSTLCTSPSTELHSPFLYNSVCPDRKCALYASARVRTRNFCCLYTVNSGAAAAVDLCVCLPSYMTKTIHWNFLTASMSTILLLYLVQFHCTPYLIYQQRFFGSSKYKIPR